MRASLWVVGSGFMGRAYVRALQHLGQPFLVIGRGDKSARELEQEYGISVIKGGVQAALQRLGPPNEAIVGVQETDAASVARNLMTAGTRRLLIEKPGALSLSDLDELVDTSRSTGCQVWVAYNRRFYASVAHARRLIAADGGLLSLTFDFTEFSHVVRELQTDERTKQRWLIANSSHVIDLAFFFAGLPSTSHYIHVGQQDWHTASSAFAGSGITSQGVPFSYLADWSAPGRWAVELRTARRKLLFQPLEELKEMPRGSFVYSPVDIDDTEDQLAKPGLIAMTRAFLLGETGDLCALDHQREAMRHYCAMAGYEDVEQGWRVVFPS